MLTKVKLSSKIQNYCNFGPKILVSTLISPPKLPIDSFRHSKTPEIDGNPVRAPKLQMDQNSTFDQLKLTKNSTFQKSNFLPIFAKTNFTTILHGTRGNYQRGKIVIFTKITKMTFWVITSFTTKNHVRHRT